MKTWGSSKVQVLSITCIKDISTGKRSNCICYSNHCHKLRYIHKNTSQKLIYPLVVFQVLSTAVPFKISMASTKIINKLSEAILTNLLNFDLDSNGKITWWKKPVHSLMLNIGLVDIRRIRYPNNKVFFLYRDKKATFSDYWLKRNSFKWYFPIDKNRPLSLATVNTRV